MKKIVFLKSALFGVMVCCLVIGLTTSCEKDDEKEEVGVFRYWESDASFVKCDFPGLDFQLNKVARTENNELEIEYTFVNRGYDYNIIVTFYSSELEPAIRDNTGRTYMCKMPNNGDYLATIDGTSFGMYGQGWNCTFRPNTPVLGRVVIKNFTQSATSIWLTFYLSSTEPNVKRTLEFINVPIENGRTTYIVQKKNEKS